VERSDYLKIGILETRLRKVKPWWGGIVARKERASKENAGESIRVELVRTEWGKFSEKCPGEKKSRKGKVEKGGIGGRGGKTLQRTVSHPQVRAVKKGHFGKSRKFCQE